MGGFGQRLKELRNQRGISQNELSKHIGVSKSSVNMYERGEREPGFETLEAIADFFNVNMDYLLGRETIEGIVNDFNPAQFSDSAIPILTRFFALLLQRRSTFDMEALVQVRNEIVETFQRSDSERFMPLLDRICVALEDELRKIEQTERPTPLDTSQGTNTER